MSAINFLTPAENLENYLPELRPVVGVRRRRRKSLSKATKMTVKEKGLENE